jgi:hypothetical protein
MKANAVSEDALAYDWDYENSRAQATLAVVKEFLGDSVGEVKEIDCNGSADDVFIKIRTSIDPFFILPDNPDEARNSGDLNLDEEEENPDKRLPRSDFGDYCPVTFVKDGFLVKGDQEFELTLYGKTFRFAGEKE